jgi:hypothetical protein
LIRPVEAPQKSFIPIYLAIEKGVSNYKVDVSMSLVDWNGEQACLRRAEFRAVLDTVAAPVIIHRSAVPEGTAIHKLKDPPLLVDAQRKAISIAGFVQGTGRMGRGDYQVNALVADELSVDLLLGTQFINSYIKLINPRSRVVLVDKGEEVALKNGAFRRSELVIVAEKIQIPPKSEAVVPVRSKSKGLCLVTSIYRKSAAYTDELHELEYGMRYLTKIGNFSDQAVALTSGMVISRAAPHEENMIFNVELDETENKPDVWHQELDLSGLIGAQKVVVSCRKRWRDMPICGTRIDWE